MKKYEVIDTRGMLLDTFDDLKDAELFIAEQARPADYDIREVACCAKNPCLSQGGLTK